MSPELYQQICDLCDEAEDQPESMRAEFLQRACPDARIRAEVEALLAADADARDRGLLGTQVGDTISQDGSTTECEPSLGQRIGPYEIRQLLGHGGMGSVFRAERVEGDFRQTVAIKVVRADRTSAEVARRFRTERQILAGLKHTNIAALLHADTTADQRPYLVMEFIDGQTIDLYCKRNDVPVRRRLELIASIADAVQYAHQRMVIHRDIKPGNILVDSHGQPKILDFGVARVTDPELQATTAQTEVGSIVGTLAYMSPEQVSGNPDDLDTRTDIYALGVLCFQLLSGRLPHRLEGKSFSEAVRYLAEAEAPPLSSVNPAFRGDLDTIVAKAMARDKSNRYTSASDLSADIRHYLRNEPITARPPSRLYYLNKFVQRNRGLVAAMSAVALTLVLGVIGTSVGLFKAQAALKKSQFNEGVAKENALQTRQAVFDSFYVISKNDSLNAPGFESLRKELLLGATKNYRQLMERNGDDPRLQRENAGVCNNLAITLRELHEYDMALVYAQDAVRIIETLMPVEPGDSGLKRLYFVALNELSHNYDALHRPEEYEQTLNRAYEVCKDLGGLGSSSQAMLCTNLAILCAGKGEHQRAMELFQQAHPLWEQAYAETPASRWIQERLTESWANQGKWYQNQNQPAKAEECFRKLQEVCARFSPPAHENINILRQLAFSHSSLAYIYDEREQQPKALAEMQTACDIEEDVWKRSPPTRELRDELASLYNDLAALQAFTGKSHEQSETLKKRQKLLDSALTKKSDK